MVVKAGEPFPTSLVSLPTGARQTCQRRNWLAVSSVSLGDVGSPVGTVGSLVGTALVGAGDVLSPGLFRPGRGGIGWFRMGGARA